MTTNNTTQSSQISHHDHHTSRQSANYKPSMWSYDFVQSLKTDHNPLQDKAYKDAWKFLEEKVKHMIDYDDDDINMLTMLEFIDDIQRLGLGYHFKEDITRALYKILNNIDGQRTYQSPHFTALSFRLLRQYGFEISQDVFSRFTDGNGSFKAWLCEDVKGMLSLYEASYFSFEGESLLDEGLAFSTIYLKNLSGYNVTKGLAEQVSHALELPLHHRMQRLEARWYIEAYSKRPDANHVLLEIAKRDFNKVQSTLQRDLKEVSRWWVDMGLAKKLSFIRDRLMECFFWSVGIVFEPQHSHVRKELTKVAALVTTIDDVYDVCGTLDELELFTSAVETWDIKAVEDLPDYMKLCFLALYNTVNEMVYDTLKEQGQNALPYVTKTWADLCKAFLKETTWRYNKHIPTFEECIYTAWISVSGVVFLAEVQGGETANSISCMTRGSMNKLNKDGASGSPFTEQFVQAARNLARISQCVYQYGDGHGAPDTRAKNRILSVIIDPIKGP
ncbi:(E)-beta-ocimene synthase [Pyrus ussuriensis x Pyrus communis]|uniref:(E)-beta-ocimene synthase n=1 Tax=Pyrus ussuriensis x Pyrus communis TaxID=2448454 RepID=A0A5N5G5B6_9ROSA|nr:(E)-beta-ocimene synthase [Pyrus ussuriensis x Pyrus communis]